MPIDPSIALGVKAPQIEDPAQKILTLRNMAQQQQAQQQEMQLRSQQMEQNRLQLAGEQRKQSEVAAMSAALKDSMEVDPATGLQVTNYQKASAKLRSQGFNEGADHLDESALNSSKSRMDFRKQLADFQAAGKEHLGELAYDATRLVESGKPMGVIRSGIIGRVAVAAGDGLISEDDAHRFIGQIGAVQDPAQLKGIFDQFLTPTIRERAIKERKDTADAAKVEAEVAGTLPETPTQKSSRLMAEAHLRLAQRADARAEKAANPFGGGGGAVGAVGGAEGPTGEAFLNTLPASQRGEIKAYAEGKRPFPTGMSYAKLQPLIAMVGQYDPTFDAANYNARNKARTDLTSPSGTGGKTISALNTAIQHAGKLSELIEALDNIDSDPTHILGVENANAIKNWWNSREGSTKVTNFTAVAPQLMKEIERVWRGAGGSVSEIQDLIKSIDKNMGKQQQREALYNFVELAKGKLDTTETQRDNVLGVGGKDIPILFDQNKPIIEKITTRGGGASKSSDSAGGFSVGQVVQVGDKKIKITKLHPDGTFDGDPVK